MSKRLQVVLEEDEYEEIRAAAESHQLTISEWVRRELREARAAAGGSVREASSSYGPAGEHGEAGAPLHIPHFPGPLHRALADRARRERRSVAAEATWLLERMLAPGSSTLLELEGLGAGLWEAVNAAEHVALERDSWA
ncbi:MAG TPA: hypothetical protein VK966_02635 [Longimicrobiales bacterium]|nr:hypothetical protein [Longimicrobiales bacterium]